MVACLVAAASQTVAGDFLVVVPVKGRASIYDSIYVTLKALNSTGGVIGQQTVIVP